MNTAEEGHQAEVNGPFWAEPLDHLLARLEASSEGLSEANVARRLQRYGYNRPKPSRRAGVAGFLLSQFRNPIVLLLIFAAGLSLFLGEAVDATIILTIVLASGLLGFWQEKGAADAVEELFAVVRVYATVVRNGECPSRRSSPATLSCSHRYLNRVTRTAVKAWIKRKPYREIPWTSLRNPLAHSTKNHLPSPSCFRGGRGWWRSSSRGTSPSPGTGAPRDLASVTISRRFRTWLNAEPAPCREPHDQPNGG